jgi:hypothetical protein
VSLVLASSLLTCEALADDTSDIERALADDAETSAAVAPLPGQATSGSAQSLNPDISLIADFAAAYFSHRDHLQTGGHDPTENGINLQALELSLSGAVDPYFRFDSHFVFSLYGVEVEEAFGTTLDLPLRLQARFGQFLTRFGRLNATHPHTWNFVDQPFAIGRVFGGEGNRGLGVELSWLTPLPWYVELVGSLTGATGAATNRSFVGSREHSVESPADLLVVGAIKQFFPLRDDWSLAFGLSAALGPNATGRDNRTDVLGADVYLKWRPLSEPEPMVVALQSEWFYRRRQIPEELLSDVSSYTELLFRFAPRWSVAGRYEHGSPTYDVDGRAFQQEPLDPEWVRHRHRVAAALTYFPTEFSRLRLQGSRDMPQTREPIHAVFLNAELMLGAHGAHAF